MYIREYKIKIQYKDREETIKLRSHNIKWTMSQYQRNREPFDWGIVQ